MLSETEIMIPDTMRRLAKGVEELADFVAVSGGELKGTDGLATAQALIAELAPADAGAAVDDDRI